MGSLSAGKQIKTAATIKVTAILIWLSILLDFRNWLMTSEEVEILKILMKGLPAAVA